MTWIGYAFALGLVAALNPCGLPLLPAYLAGFVDADQQRWPGRIARGLLAGLMMTLGFVLVFAVIGIPIAAGVRLLIGWSPWVMIAVGAALVVVGLPAVLGRPWTPTVPGISRLSTRGPFGMIGYGVAYALGSLSCALPLFTAGVASSFLNRGAASGLMALLAYAFGMGLFVIAAAIAVSLFGGGLIRRVGRAAHILPGIAAGLVVVVGAYLVVFWTTTLLDPALGSRLGAVIDALSASLGNRAGSASLTVGAVLTVAIAATAMAAAVARRRGQRAEGTNTHVE